MVPEPAGHLEPPGPGDARTPEAADNRDVNSQMTASLGDLIFIAIIPTVLLAGWLITIYRAARDYDRPSPGASPEHLPERREGG
jgi:hypothetical protein